MTKEEGLNGMSCIWVVAEETGSTTEEDDLNDVVPFCVDKKNYVIGTVYPPRTVTFETGRVRSGSKTLKLSTRPGPPRYILKRVGPVPSNLSPARPVPSPSWNHPKFSNELLHPERFFAGFSYNDIFSLHRGISNYILFLAFLADSPTIQSEHISKVGTSIIDVRLEIYVCIGFHSQLCRSSINKEHVLSSS
ncbi:hypothetical protein ACFX14_007110 [Malus domestica]